jgi:hypothetical protein
MDLHLPVHPTGGTADLRVTGPVTVSRLLQEIILLVGEMQ